MRLGISVVEKVRRRGPNYLGKARTATAIQIPKGSILTALKSGDPERVCFSIAGK
jgi:hypothetical protein